MQNDQEHLILLNRLVSRSISRSSHAPPTHSGIELLEVLDARAKKNIAIEYFGAEDDADEGARIAKGTGHNFIRLRQLLFEQTAAARYASLLFEYVDERVRSFPVVHRRTFAGREIAGADDERGAAAAHVVVRFPGQGAYDDGDYRCAIEAVHGVTRHDIETFFSRQFRRHAAWTFTVVVKKGKGKAKTKEFSYRPRLDLFADVGRTLNGALSGDSVLSHMVFTKRSTKQSIGKSTQVTHEDFLADVEIRVSARQGPADPEERRTWLGKVRDWYEQSGFESRLYFRQGHGRTLSGEINHAVAGATDLLMCPRQIIYLAEPAKRWRPTLDAAICTEMKALLEQDDLWERAK